MKHFPPKRWKNRDNTQGLLLFAQRVEELLFDYTLDSYQAPALNTHYRVVELLDAAIAVQRRELKLQALGAMIEELASSVASDEAARALLQPNPEEFGSPSFWDTSDLPELITRAGFARRQLGQGNYKNELIRRLQVLLPVAHEKEQILQHTRDLVVEWVNEGRPPGAIYYQCRRHFFDSSGKKIEDCTAFDGFVELMSGVRHKWTVIFKAASSFSSLTHLLTEPFSILQEVVPVTAAARERQFLDEHHDGVYLSVAVETTDALRARQTAERQLATLADVARFHLHRSPFSWQRQALVRRGGEWATVIEEPASPMMKYADCSENELLLQVARSVRFTINLDRSSSGRLSRALNLHSTAVETSAVENQLINLWSAFETLLPMDTSDSRIARVLDLLVPALSRNYPRKLIRDLHAKLLRYAQEPYIHALTLVPETGSEIAQLAAMLALKANWDLWIPVYERLGDSPLMINRIASLAKQLVNPRAIRLLVDEHEKRVSWHLNRIYRTRNMVAHAGRRLPYTSALVENLHSFFHQLLEQLHEIVEREKNLKTIDEALLHVRLEHQAHRSILASGGNRDCTPDTFQQYIFGITA